MGIIGIVEYGTITTNDTFAINGISNDDQYVVEIKINGKTVNQATVGNKIAVILNNVSPEDIEGARDFSNAENLHNKNSEMWSNQWVNRYTAKQKEEKAKEDAKLRIKHIFKRKSLND